MEGVSEKTCNYLIVLQNEGQGGHYPWDRPGALGLPWDLQIALGSPGIALCNFFSPELPLGIPGNPREKKREKCLPKFDTRKFTKSHIPRAFIFTKCHKGDRVKVC